MLFYFSFQIRVNNESNSEALGPGTSDEDLANSVPYRRQCLAFPVFCSMFRFFNSLFQIHANNESNSGALRPGNQFTKTCQNMFNGGGVLGILLFQFCRIIFLITKSTKCWCLEIPKVLSGKRKTLKKP